MSAVTARPPADTARPHVGRLVLALAGVESRRLARSPVLWAGLALTALFAWDLRSPEIYAGARYTTVPLLVGPLAVTIAMAVAGSFHRERVELAPDAPVEEAVRAGARLLATWVPLALVGLVTIAECVWVAAQGGLGLGDEPGRTLHAYLSAPQQLQNVAVTILAVATGAAAGRRVRNRATSTLLLFVGWFPFVMASWAFMAPQVAPWSILLVQPVNLNVAPGDTDPLTLPSSWLLSQPGEYQDYWGRAFVSADLAVWHDLWLVGLAMLFLAIAIPGRWRRRLLVAGVLLTGVAIAAQYAVIP